MSLMMIAATVLGVCGLVVLAILWYKKANEGREFYSKFPGPPPLPILGNALEFSDTTESLNVALKFNKKYGESFLIRLGPFFKLVVVADHRLLELIMSSTKTINKSIQYNYFHNWLGTGLLTSAGPKWKKHRKIITPAFHFQILENFIGVFESAASVLVKKLEAEVDKNSIDIFELVSLCALDIIGDSAMGIKLNAQKSGESEYVKSVFKISRIVIDRTTNILSMHDWTYPLISKYYLEKKLLKVLHQYTNNVINTRREELKKAKTLGNNDNEIDGIKRKKPFLDSLLEANVDGRPLTQEEIREEVDTFMFEGHDTTASCVGFALYCLANYPDVQQKAFQEQEEIFGDVQKCQVKYSDLQKMKYLEQVIKETLRLYPSVPYYAREANEELEFEGSIIPKGATFILFAFGVHRNPKYFPNPEKFNPSRFDDIDGKLPFAYIPFSAGSRNCIGQKFAMLELKSVMSKILRNFELVPAVPVHNLRLSADMILRSLNGVKIGIRRRTAG